MMREVNSVLDNRDHLTGIPIKPCCWVKMRDYKTKVAINHFWMVDKEIVCQQVNIFNKQSFYDVKTAKQNPQH